MKYPAAAAKHSKNSGMMIRALFLFRLRELPIPLRTLTSYGVIIHSVMIIMVYQTLKYYFPYTIILYHKAVSFNSIFCKNIGFSDQFMFCGR